MCNEQIWVICTNYFLQKFLFCCNFLYILCYCISFCNILFRQWRIFYIAEREALEHYISSVKMCCNKRWKFHVHYCFLNDFAPFHGIGDAWKNSSASSVYFVYDGTIMTEECSSARKWQNWTQCASIHLAYRHCALHEWTNEKMGVRIEFYRHTFHHFSHSGTREALELFKSTPYIRWLPPWYYVSKTRLRNSNL